MSRIPPVRPWRVTYRRDGKLVAQVYVDTINKRFARWFGRDAAMGNGYMPRFGDTVTVSLVKIKESRQ